MTSLYAWQKPTHNTEAIDATYGTDDSVGPIADKQCVYSMSCFGNGMVHKVVLKKVPDTRYEPDMILQSSNGTEPVECGKF